MSKTVRVPKFEGNEKIGWEEKSVRMPGVGQLLLEVKANALGSSDREQFYRGSEFTPGCEASGIVIEAGPCTVHSVGTPGVVFLMDYCGTCRNCQRCAHLLCNLRQGKQPPIHASAGLRAVLLADAAIKSYESGQTVVLTDIRE